MIATIELDNNFFVAVDSQDVIMPHCWTLPVSRSIFEESGRHFQDSTAFLPVSDVEWTATTRMDVFEPVSCADFRALFCHLRPSRRHLILNICSSAAFSFGV